MPLRHACAGFCRRSDVRGPSDARRVAPDGSERRTDAAPDRSRRCSDRKRRDPRREPGRSGTLRRGQRRTVQRRDDVPRPADARRRASSPSPASTRIPRSTSPTRAPTRAVTVTLESVGEIRVGEPFDIVATVGSTPARAPLRCVSATADAYMPRHFHGMNVTPETTTRTGDGSTPHRGHGLPHDGPVGGVHRLSNLGVTERAQFEFEVE